jgi:hypothetical protein
MMILPNNCPICNDVMLTEFKGEYTTLKTCLKHLSHGIKITAGNNKDRVMEVDLIALRLNDTSTKWIYWRYDSHLYVVTFPALMQGMQGMQSSPSLRLRLPYFAPDFSDYNKLMNKIKLYILFS